ERLFVGEPQFSGELVDPYLLRQPARNPLVLVLRARSTFSRRVPPSSHVSPASREARRPRPAKPAPAAPGRTPRAGGPDQYNAGRERRVPHTATPPARARGRWRDR